MLRRGILATSIHTEVAAACGYSRLAKKIREERGEPVRFTRVGKFVRPAGTDVSLHRRIRRKANLHGVFPDVLPDSFVPHITLNVAYETHTVRKGHFLPPAAAQTTPKVTFEASKAAHKAKYYTLLMVSPDDPQIEDLPNPRERGTEVLHWAVTNIPAAKTMDSSAGTELLPYLPPNPRKGADFRYRYVFLLFEHDEALASDSPLLTAHLSGDGLAPRCGFNTYRLSEYHRLSPAGMAFFVSSWDPTVRALYTDRLRDTVEPAADSMTLDEYRRLLFKPRKYLWDPSLW